MLILGICPDLVLLLSCALIHAAIVRDGVSNSPLSLFPTFRVIHAHGVEIAGYPHQLRIPINLPHVVYIVIIHGIEDGLVFHDEPVLIRLYDVPLRDLWVTGDVGILGLEEVLLILPSIIVLDAQAWGSIRQRGLISEDFVE